MTGEEELRLANVADFVDALRCIAERRFLVEGDADERDQMMGVAREALEHAGLVVADVDAVEWRARV